MWWVVDCNSQYLKKYLEQSNALVDIHLLHFLYEVLITPCDILLRRYEKTLVLQTKLFLG